MKEKIYKQLITTISINTSEACNCSNRANANTLHYLSGYNDAVIDIISIIDEIERTENTEQV